MPHEGFCLAEGTNRIFLWTDEHDLATCSVCGVVRYFNPTEEEPAA